MYILCLRECLSDFTFFPQVSCPLPALSNLNNTMHFKGQKSTFRWDCWIQFLFWNRSESHVTFSNVETVQVIADYLFSLEQIKALNSPWFLKQHLKSHSDPRATQKFYQTEQTCRKIFLPKGVFLSWKLALVCLIHAYLMFKNSSEAIGTVFLLEKHTYVSVRSS